MKCFKRLGGVVVATMLGVSGGEAQAQVIPGGRPEDAVMARSNPDEYAWQLFLALNRQALPGSRGVIDTSKPSIRSYDLDQPVVWETWAHSSGGRFINHFPAVNYSEVFLDRGATPPPWNQLPALGPKGLDAPREFHDPDIKSKRNTSDFSASAIDPGSSTASGMAEEVVVNRATYETFLTHELYNIEGLEKLFHRAQSGFVLDYPAAAQEVKARWARITEAEKPRYHWRTLRMPDGTTQLWGLTGLHIITRDLPNWFWATWEHVDYLALPVHKTGQGLAFENAEYPSVDVTTRGANAPARGTLGGVPVNGLRRETVGSKWQNYQLRGTQIDYVDASGNYTVVANTQIERTFQQTSSCITCHARAAVGLRAQNPDGSWPRVPNKLFDFLQVTPVLVGPVGKENPRELFFEPTGQMKYAPIHFVWSPVYRAQSKYQ